MRNRRKLMVGAVLVVSLPGITLAGWDQTLKLKPNHGALDERFGIDVAVSGNTALVGSVYSDGSNTGSAYLFNATTGRQIAQLQPNDVGADDWFGSSVALDGNIAMVASRQDDDNGFDSGSVYLFSTITGLQIAKLKPSDGAANDWFGQSVALSGGLAVVGSPGDDDNGAASGSAYVFDHTSGTQIAKLMPADGAMYDSFGTSVALSGNRVLAGSYLDDDNGTDSGSAYLFDAATGTQTAKLKPSDGAAGDGFGYSVSISGNTALVGSPFRTEDVFYVGSAYLFDVSTGAQLAKLTPTDAEKFDRFGISVALSGNRALVGSYLDDDGGTNSGSAYLFDVATGSQLAKLTPADGAAGDLFGFAVALSGNIALVGSGLDDDNGTDSGSAYLFTPDNLDPNPISGGTIAFTPVRPGVSITLDDIPSIANTGGPGSVIHVTGFSFTGPDAALFDLPGYSDVTLTAGAFDTIAYDLMFLGSDLIGDYSATLTLFTDSGNVTYGIQASVIPEPTTLALLAMMGWLGARRRG